MNFAFDLLRPWQWGLLLAVPPAIVLLYFLKLKREPLEVPSTYLWSRTVEDLHVNSIWQRLRRNLLLLLQLLLLLLAILACLNPNWRSTKLADDRIIFLIDNSASMSATDVAPSRLEEAKRQADALVDEMRSGYKAMIIAFSDADGAYTVQSYTDNRRLLKRKLATIQPTHRKTDLRKALRFAAGLANPGSAAFEDTDAAAADAMPASLYILSDGRVSRLPEFSMGNLNPTYIPIGVAEAQNVGIAAFQSANNPERPSELQAFANIRNYGANEATVALSLYHDEKMIDATSLTLDGGSQGGAEFSLQNVEKGVLRLQIDSQDDLAVDNQAFAVLDTTQRARILLVTPGNVFLETAFTTDRIKKYADIKTTKPDYLTGEEYKKEAADGLYDLVIFDECAPETAALMPASNTMFIGKIPPSEGWSTSGPDVGPTIIDSDQSHPIMQFMTVTHVLIGDALPLQPPKGATTLVDTDLGPIMAVATRDSVQDLVVGFAFIGRDDDGSEYFNTTWVRNDPSYPVFIQNVLSYLGGVSEQKNSQIFQPGQLIQLRLDTPSKRLKLKTPDGRNLEVGRGRTGAFSFSRSDRIGIYELTDPAKPDTTHRVAVNLFDETESDIPPLPELQIDEHVKVAGTKGVERARRETWKWLAVLALIVLMVEWYIYNRRVYL